VVGGIDPGDAFRVSATDLPRESTALGIDAQNIGLRTIQPANQPVMAGFRDLGRIIA